MFRGIRSLKSFQQANISRGFSSAVSFSRVNDKQRSSYNTFVGLASTALFGGIVASSQLNADKQLPTVDAKAPDVDLVGAYEDRIRQFSTPDKIFELFASVTIQDETGELMRYMTPQDFFRAVAPAPRSHGPPTAQDGDLAILGNPGLSTIALQAQERNNKLIADKVTALTSSSSSSSSSSATVFHVKSNPYIATPLPESHPLHAFYMLCDQDGDGLISYSEYVMMRVLVALPLHKIRIIFRMFDTNDTDTAENSNQGLAAGADGGAGRSDGGDGGIDVHEWLQVMQALKLSSQGGRQAARDEKSLTGQKRHSDEELAMVKRFFGSGVDKDGDGLLREDEFIDYVEQLKGEMVKASFIRFDADGSGALDALEFGEYLIANCSRRRRRVLRSRLQAARAKGTLPTETVSLNDLQGFCEVLHNLDQLRTAMWLLSAPPSAATGHGGGVAKEDLSFAMNAALDNQRRSSSLSAKSQPDIKESTAISSSISPVVIDVLMTLFDEEGDGRLSEKELCDVLSETATMGESRRRDMGVVDALSTLGTCLKHELSTD